MKSPPNLSGVGAEGIRCKCCSEIKPLYYWYKHKWCRGCIEQMMKIMTKIMEENECL
jgi:hypothetical protein